MSESPWRKYLKHKVRANYRGIPFVLTFEEWWEIWDKSGHWEERGRGTGSYVMSRVADLGGYEVGNVFIQTSRQNIIDGTTGKTPRLGKKLSAESRKKMSKSHKGIKFKKIECPICHKIGPANTMTRYHQKEHSNDQIFV